MARCRPRRDRVHRPEAKKLKELVKRLRARGYILCEKYDYEDPAFGYTRYTGYILRSPESGNRFRVRQYTNLGDFAAPRTHFQVDPCTRGTEFGVLRRVARMDTAERKLTEIARTFQRTPADRPIRATGPSTPTLG